MQQMTVEKAKKFNDDAFEKLTGYKQMSAEQEMMKQKCLMDQQINNTKRLERLHKSCTSLLGDIKKKHNDKVETVIINK
jgi:hypothetical protein